MREGDAWRVVGQFPDGSADEALAYFERKFPDLASEVRAARGAPAPGRRVTVGSARSRAHAAREASTGAAAVGDLASLEARVLALTERARRGIRDRSGRRTARPSTRRSRARTELVEKAEALAARDPSSVQWKQASTELTALFDQWQSQQQNGPRLPKSTCAAALEAVPGRPCRPSTSTAASSTPSSTRRTRPCATASPASSRRPRRSHRRARTASPPTGSARSVEDRRPGRQEGRRRAVGTVQGRGRRPLRRPRRARGGRERSFAREDRGRSADCSTRRGGRRRGRHRQGAQRSDRASSAAGTRSAASSRATKSGRSMTSCARSSRRCAAARRTTGSATTPRPRPVPTT